MKDIFKGAISFEEYHKESMKDPKYKKAWDDLEVEFQIINLVVKKRIEMKLTQKQLAKKLGTKQPVISRLEQGNFNPSVKFLKRLAKALDAKLEITIT